MPNITDYTNQIQDGRAARSIYDLAYEILEGNFTRKIAGATYSVTATEMDQRVFTLKLEDASVGKSVYAVVPWTGNVTTIYAVGDGTQSQSEIDVYSFGGNGIAMSGNTITVASAATIGAAFGNVSPTTAYALAAGQVFRASCNGFSTGASQHIVFSVLMDIT